MSESATAPEMGACVECGKRLPRGEMYGYGDEKRCAACADRGRKKYLPPRTVSVHGVGSLSVGVVAVAALLTLAYWESRFPIGRYLAADAPGIWNGEVWRFLTAALLHGGVFHLFFNGYVLVQIGSPLEKYLGGWRYMGLLVLLAFAAGGAQFMVTVRSAIGLSGVVYGVFGFLYAWRRHHDFARVICMTYARWLALWFFACIALSYMGILAIANIAHGMGAVAGFAVGWAALQRPMPLRNAFLAGIAVLTAAIVAMAVWMPWDEGHRAWRIREAVQRGDVEAARRLAAEELRRQGLDPEYSAAWFYGRDDGTTVTSPEPIPQDEPDESAGSDAGTDPQE